MKRKQVDLFTKDTKSYVEREWDGMPEYDHDFNKPFQRIVVNFKTKEDVLKFAELIGQKLSFTTDTIWFPKINRGRSGVYVDES